MGLLALMMILIGRLTSRGLLSLDETKEDVDRAMLLVEQMGLGEQDQRSAHDLLGVVLALLSGQPEPPKGL